MPPTRRDNVLIWGTDLEEEAIQQAGRASRLPFLAGPLALMPDAHFGMGATVGSVIPTRGAIIPAAVGVDIGCGMIAAETNLTAADLPDNLDALMPLIEQRIPAGIPTKRNKNNGSHGWDAAPNVEALIGWPKGTELTGKQRGKTISQFGTLGSGNHFVEVCLDERAVVWIVLHSGSRGIGNQLATKHIDIAKGLMKEYFIKLEDPDLAYFVQGTPEFTAYLDDLMWGQDYALGNREAMMDQAMKSLFEVVGHGTETDRINAHHNYTAQENHHGQDIWVTRKGAIKADVTDRGVIPGSMGTRSYIVQGLGSAASYNSCSHGAGRRMSRGRAKRELSPELFAQQMAGKTWNHDRAASLLDEAPLAYKDIDQVMADQSDLVTVLHTLSQVFNYKG